MAPGGALASPSSLPGPTREEGESTRTHCQGQSPELEAWKLGLKRGRPLTSTEPPPRLWPSLCWALWELGKRGWDEGLK